MKLVQSVHLLQAVVLPCRSARLTAVWPCCISHCVFDMTIGQMALRHQVI